MPKKNVYILGIAIVAAVAGLLFGFDVGIIAGALPFIEKTFNIITLPNAKLSYQLFGFIPVSGIFIAEYIVAAVPGGALLGAMISAKFAQQFGRKNSIIITAGLFFLGALMACSAINFNFLIISRTLMGFAIGISATIVPMYVAEVAPAEIRGAAIFLYQMAITVGIFFSAMVSYVFTTASEPSWRYMFALELIPAALLGIGMLMLPKSPRWLMRRGRVKAALTALKRLRQSSELEVQKEIEAIETSLSAINQKRTSFRDLFSKPLRILVVVAAGLFFFQQFTGVNTLFYYAPLIFQSAGFKGINGAFIAAIIVTGINMLATFFGMWFVDSLGRRKLLLYGLLGIVLCMFTMGAAYHDWFSHKNIVVLISALLFIACFAVSISGICYIIMSEIFPLNIRSKGMAIASCANWGFNWLVASTFLTLVNISGLGNVYWFYATCSLVGFIFVFFLVPETKNHTLEEITKNLYEGVPVRHLGDPALAKKYISSKKKR